MITIGTKFVIRALGFPRHCSVGLLCSLTPLVLLTYGGLLQGGRSLPFPPVVPHFIWIEPSIQASPNLVLPAASRSPSFLLPSSGCPSETRLVILQTLLISAKQPSPCFCDPHQLCGVSLQFLTSIVLSVSIAVSPGVSVC